MMLCIETATVAQPVNKADHFNPRYFRSPIELPRASIFGSAEKAVPTTDENIPSPATELNIPSPATEPSVVCLRPAVDHAKARFRMLRRLVADHDSGGALAPDPSSVDAAIAFLDRLNNFDNLMATVSDSGSAVIEIHGPESGYFGEITFLSDGKVECYRRRENYPSALIEGELESTEIKRFLMVEMSIDCDQQ